MRFVSFFPLPFNTDRCRIEEGAIELMPLSVYVDCFKNNKCLFPRGPPTLTITSLEVTLKNDELF